MEPLRADRVANTAITTFTSFLPSGGMVGKLAAGAFVALGAALYVQPISYKRPRFTESNLVQILVSPIAHIEQI